MSTEAEIITRTEERVGSIELNRPRRANAYSDVNLEAMEAALKAHMAASEVRVIVFASAVEGMFCSGADLDELGQRDAAGALDLRSMEVFDTVAACPKPTMAAIDGPAVAGGLELALACDLRIASERARFAMPETSLAIIPAAGATFRLPAVVGEALARQMILFGAELDARQALDCGLVSEVVAPEELDDRVRWWAGKVGERDPLALRLAKQAISIGAAEGGSREFTRCAQAVLYERRNRRSDGDG